MKPQHDNCTDKCAYVDLILREFDSLRKTQTAILDNQTSMGIDIALLKYKSGLFGALAGLIPGIISSVAVFLSTNPH